MSKTHPLNKNQQIKMKNSYQSCNKMSKHIFTHFFVKYVFDKKTKLINKKINVFFANILYALISNCFWSFFLLLIYVCELWVSLKKEDDIQTSRFIDTFCIARFFEGECQYFFFIEIVFKNEKYYEQRNFCSFKQIIWIIVSSRIFTGREIVKDKWW